MKTNRRLKGSRDPLDRVNLTAFYMHLLYNVRQKCSIKSFQIALTFFFVEIVNFFDSVLIDADLGFF